MREPTSEPDGASGASVPLGDPSRDGTGTAETGGTADTAEAAEAPAAPTRAQRRSHREAKSTTAPLPPRALAVPPLALGAVIALASLTALAAQAHPYVLTAAVALTTLVLAVTWPSLVGLPTPQGSSVVLTVSGAALLGSVVPVTQDPYLRHVAIAVAVGLSAVFVHQLIRKDGRPRLTESVALTVVALVVMLSGTTLLSVVNVVEGPALIGCAMAGVVGAVTVDILAMRPRLRAWLLPVALAVGGAAGAAAAHLLGQPRLALGALTAMVAAGMSFIVRRTLVVLPSSGSMAGQLAAAAASVLVVGALVQQLSRLFLP